MTGNNTYKDKLKKLHHNKQTCLWRHWWTISVVQFRGMVRYDKPVCRQLPTAAMEQHSLYASWLHLCLPNKCKSLNVSLSSLFPFTTMSLVKRKIKPLNAPLYVHQLVVNLDILAVWCWASGVQAVSELKRSTCCIDSIVNLKVFF